MTPERWQRVKTVFRDALDRPPAARGAFVADACAGDEAVRAEVDRLLALDADSETFMATPAARLGPRADAPPDPLVGQRVGQFDLRRRIAVGGMGAVYEADQESPRRTVAVKVLRPAFATGSTWRRFEYEAHVLGRLQHPGIAQIFEAGTFDLGAGAQPYFAMELIDGRPLDRDADARDLDADARLELIARVCDAVQHAHQKGVIHRDLKPSNILVDAGGQPKVLDFGVARATDADVQATTMHTSLGELVGTINYMSPEQVTGDPDEVDTRSDVYTLGVIGYELLTGKLPYDIAGKSITEALRTIESDQPVPLSAIRRVFRGDLETIFAKAVEKDRSRRYQSAADLAADIRRHLDDEPIVARRPTAAYQLRKFAKRNRALVAGAAATVLALVLGLVLTAMQARRARFEADRYQYEADKARAVTNFVTNDFLMKLLASVGAVADEQGVPIERLMDEATDNVEVLFKDRPLEEAAVRNELGTMYYNLGLFEKSETEFRRCLERWEGVLGADHPDTLKAVNNLGQALAKQSRAGEALPLYRRALEAQARVLGEDDPFTLVSMNNLATLLRLRGELDEAETLLRRAIDGHRRTHGPRHRNTLHMMLNLSSLLQDRGDLAGAEAMRRETVAGLERALGEDHPSTLVARSMLAQTLRARGALDETESLLREIRPALARTLGPDHVDTITVTRFLARVLDERGKGDEAATVRAMIPEDH